MPRKARIDAPGALHHIIVRGIEKKAIFRNVVDRKDFLKRLRAILLDTETSCYGWVLMRNHVHLLFRTGLVPIATVMQRLLTGYAGCFNRRYRRHGHLFQNRYKSFLCEEQLYLKELVRYIHLNPLRAKVVKDLNQLKRYAFCGHSVLMGQRKNDWQDSQYVLRLFGESVSATRRSYGAYVAKGVSQGRRSDLVGGGLVRSVGGWSILKALRGSGLRIKGDERILGSSDFVERVLKEANEQFEQRLQLDASSPGLDKLIGKVAGTFELPVGDLKTSSKHRRIVQARAVLCYLAVRKLRFSCADVARQLNISPNTVSMAVSRGQKIEDIKKIQKQVLGI
jgi:REP element-mobilizing transposase RayT/DNA-binding CsgD family transcriptional regulator